LRLPREEALQELVGIFVRSEGRLQNVTRKMRLQSKRGRRSSLRKHAVGHVPNDPPTSRAKNVSKLGDWNPFNSLSFPSLMAQPRLRFRFR
jgi:hypothetical protein